MWFAVHQNLWNRTGSYYLYVLKNIPPANSVGIHVAPRKLHTNHSLDQGFHGFSWHQICLTTCCRGSLLLLSLHLSAARVQGVSPSNLSALSSQKRKVDFQKWGCSMCVYVYLLGNWKIHVPLTPFLLAGSGDHAWLNPQNAFFNSRSGAISPGLR